MSTFFNYLDYGSAAPSYGPLLNFQKKKKKKFIPSSAGEKFRSIYKKKKKKKIIPSAGEKCRSF